MFSCLSVYEICYSGGEEKGEQLPELLQAQAGSVSNGNTQSQSQALLHTQESWKCTFALWQKLVWKLVPKMLRDLLCLRRTLSTSESRSKIVEAFA